MNKDEFEIKVRNVLEKYVGDHPDERTLYNIKLDLNQQFDGVDGVGFTYGTPEKSITVEASKDGAQFTYKMAW